MRGPARGRTGRARSIGERVDVADARKRLEEELDRVRAWADGGFKESERDSLSELSFEDQHPADVATETLERESELSIRQMAEARIAEIGDALARIEDGTYGRCEMCGRPIDESRLAARPSATLCLDDQRRAERARG